ncbi:hypothetical protein Tco_1064310 [Tanacetum coccineum]
MLVIKIHAVAHLAGFFLWYPKDSSFALTAFVDADHAGYQDTRRSTSGSIQLLGDRLYSSAFLLSRTFRFGQKLSLSVPLCAAAAISSTEADYIALSGSFVLKSLGF